MTTTDEVKAVLDDLTGAFNERFAKLEAKMNRHALRLGGTDREDGAFAGTEEGKAFESFLRTGERKAMSLGSDPDGGYAAPPQFADAITLVGAEQGALRGLARVFPTDSADFNLPISSTLAGAGRTTEMGTRGETTTPGLADFRPASGGMYANAPVSNWLLNDSKYDIAALVTESIGTQFGVTESADFVTGDGVNKARGFTTYPLAATADAARAWATLEKLHAGSTSAISIDNLIDLLGKLAPRYRKRAAWVYHPDTETALRKLKDATTGTYYWAPSVAAGTPPTMLGLPCFPDVNMPTIASGAAAVGVADWQKFYGIIDVGRMMFLRDPYTAKGKTLFYVEKRVGGGVIDFNAGKLLVMST